MVFQIPGSRGLIGCRNGVFVCTGDFAEILIFHSLGKNQSQVVGGCVMIGVRQTIGVDKMGIFAAQFCSTGIHHIGECTDGTGYLHGHLGADFIGRGQHNGIQTLLHRQFFAYLGINRRVSRCQIRQNHIGKSNLLV